VVVHCACFLWCGVVVDSHHTERLCRLCLKFISPSRAQQHQRRSPNSLPGVVSSRRVRALSRLSSPYGHFGVARPSLLAVRPCARLSHLRASRAEQSDRDQRPNRHRRPQRRRPPLNQRPQIDPSVSRPIILTRQPRTDSEARRSTGCRIQASGSRNRPHIPKLAR
jgi:hypothetical protein